MGDWVLGRVRQPALVVIPRPLPGPSLDHGSIVTAEIHPLCAWLYPSAGGRAIRGAMFALDAKPLQLTAHIPPGDVFGTAATCLFASVCKWDYHGDENDDDDEDDGDNKDQGF